MRKNQSSRLLKILNASANVGKYASFASIGMLLGCVPLPNTFSLSPDGRYVIAPVNQKGDIEIGEEEHKIAVIDTKNNSIDYLDGGEGDHWFSNTQDKIVFTTKEEEREEKNGETMISKIPSLVIFNGGEKQVIKNASYGNISDNGDFLVYSGGLKSDPENLSASLRVRNLKIGGERDLGLEGMFANISPDNKTICYLGFEMNDLNEPEDAYIGTCNIEGKERKVLMPLGKGFRGALYSPPEWINNNEMIYAAKDPKGKDLELFIMNKSGKIKQLTDNDTQESSPQHYKNNIIFYVRGDEKDRGELFFAKPSGGKLVHQNLEIDAFYPKIRGDKIVYFGNLDTKDCSANLYIANVKDLLKGDKSSIVNLSKIIKKDIEAKKIF